MGATALHHLRQADRHLEAGVLVPLRPHHPPSIRVPHGVPKTCHPERRRQTVNYRTVTIGEIALVIIAIFIALAYFNGFG